MIVHLLSNLKQFQENGPRSRPVNRRTGVRFFQWADDDIKNIGGPALTFNLLWQWCLERLLDSFLEQGAGRRLLHWLLCAGGLLHLVNNRVRHCRYL